MTARAGDSQPGARRELEDTEGRASGVTKLWTAEGGGVGGPPLVIRATGVTLCGPVCLSRLCLRLSRPALPIWDVPARIRLLAGERCYLPSNLFGGFSGEGTSAGWGHGGIEARWAAAGAGNEAQPGIGVVQPRDPSGLLPAPCPRSGITQGAGDTLCHLRAAVGQVWDSREVRAHCTTPCAPVMTAAMAGGDRSHSSAPSEISPCTSSFTRACWLTEVTPAAFSTVI